MPKPELQTFEPRAKSGKLQKQKDSVSIGVSEKLETLDVMDDETIPSEKVKQIKDKQDSIAVVDDEKLESAPTLQIEKPNKKNLKVQNINERRPSLNISEIENIETVKILSDDITIPELANQSVKEDMPNVSVDIREKVDTFEHVEAEEEIQVLDKQKIQPKKIQQEENSIKASIIHLKIVGRWPLSLHSNNRLLVSVLREDLRSLPKLDF